MNVTATQVTNTSGNHNKFYRIYVLDSGYEIRQWGPIGTRGRFKQIQHGSLAAASLSMRDKIDEEIMKGYHDKEVYTFEIQPGVNGTLTNDGLMDGFWNAKHRAKTPPPFKIDPEPDPDPESSYQHILWETA